MTRRIASVLATVGLALGVAACPGMATSTPQAAALQEAAQGEPVPDLPGYPMYVLGAHTDCIINAVSYNGGIIAEFECTIMK